jgi:hypothetical protein
MYQKLELDQLLDMLLGKLLVLIALLLVMLPLHLHHNHLDIDKRTLTKVVFQLDQLVLIPLLLSQLMPLLLSLRLMAL